MADTFKLDPLAVLDAAPYDRLIYTAAHNVVQKDRRDAIREAGGG